VAALKRLDSVGAAADIEWLNRETTARPLPLNIPDSFSREAIEFARLALTRNRLLWSCHYAIDRFAPTLWVLARRDCLPALIVCPPASLPTWKSVWDESLRELLPSNRELTVAEYGTKRCQNGVDVILLTYDRLKRRDVRDLAALVQVVRAVILDESHWAREETTQRYRAVAQLTGMLQSETPIIAISTQPVANRTRELCVQLGLIGIDEAPLLDPARLRAMLAAHPDRVAHKLADLGHVIHHGESAVRDYLPAITRRLIPVKISAASRREIVHLQREFEEFLTTGNFSNPATLSAVPSRGDQRARDTLALRTGSELSGMLVKAPRMDVFDKFSAALLLDQIRTETARGKVAAALVFIRKQMRSGSVLVMVEQRYLGERLAKDLKLPFIHGSMTPPQRRAICQQFQDGEHPGLVLSIGLQNVPPLTQAAIVVVVDMPWNQALIDRALRCVRRPGVGHDLTVYVLTDDEHGLEGFIRHLHAYKVVVAEALLQGIDPSDDQLVAVLREGIALEAAGLHPDDWFKGADFELRAPVRAVLSNHRPRTLAAKKNVAS